MAFCLACQDWTENINCQIRVCANQRLRETSICKGCGARKSVFLKGDSWKACILEHRTYATDHAVSNRQQQQQQYDTNERHQEPRQESGNTIPTQREIFAARDREFQGRLEKNIRHQWNIDHVDGYYEQHKDAKRKASLRVNVY